MSNLSKKAAIKDKRNYQKQPSDLKRKGPSMDLREFLLKKMKNNEGEGVITNDLLKKMKNNEGEGVITNEKQEKNREEGVIRVSTSGKSKNLGFFHFFLVFF